jgi:predicted DsbA family dithiol-disulfide isomerase
MITVDVYHDTVCPWCRIGKRHLQLALVDWDGPPVETNFHAFYLNPDLPAEGYEFAPYMLAKGGGQISLEQFFDRPREMGARVGLTFNFEEISRAPNTTLSHQLIAITPEDQREAMIDAVYYFEHGRDIGDLEVLLAIAADQGFDPVAVREQLAAGAGLDAVQADLDFTRRQGISGVPFFIFNDRYAFSGAQPPHMIRRVLEQVAAETAMNPGDSAS